MTDEVLGDNEAAFELASEPYVPPDIAPPAKVGVVDGEDRAVCTDADPVKRFSNSFVLKLRTQATSHE